MKPLKRSKTKSPTSKNKIVLFDLDRTLVKHNSSIAFLAYLYSRKEISLIKLLKAFSYHVRTLYFGMTLTEMHMAAFKTILQGAPIDKLHKRAAAFLGPFLKENQYEPAVIALKKALKQGHYVAIVSSSPSFLVGPISKFFQVDHWISTEYGVDKDNLVCKIANLMEGGAKADFLELQMKRLKIDRSMTEVYTDSIHDLPLIEKAGRVVTVNPEKRLRRLAIKKSWEII
jgi:HAD superfamily hydrolase (TIGR01490 family)